MAAISDPVLEALDAVLAALGDTETMRREIVRRAKVVRNARDKGRSFREIAGVLQRPHIVELLRMSQERLALSGAVLRRAAAVALRAEGLTVDEIAKMFGVTRPRIIHLLHDALPGDGAQPGPNGRATRRRAPQP